MCVVEAGVKLSELPINESRVLLQKRAPGVRIWHEGADGTSVGVNGVNATIWLLARQQARLGNDVTLLLREVPSAAALAAAKAAGIRLLYLGGGIWHVNARELAAAIAENRPDVVHMHSAFIPRQASLARQLRRLGVSYITTPHGRLAPEVFHHNRLQKSLYAKFIERPRCRAAAMVTATVGEETGLRSFLGADSGPIRSMPVGIDAEMLGTGRWQGNLAGRRLVFLGRFDVHLKGIDVLLGIAGLMRDHEFHLYGVQDRATSERLRQLRCGCGSNVFFHPPVYGDEKAQVLCDATFYIQMSRSEALGVSIAEAMHLGVPCAISEEIHLAAAFREHDLGLLLPVESAAAAMALTRALRSPELLVRWSQRSRDYSRMHFDACSAAKRHVALYREVIDAAMPQHAMALAK